MLPLLLTVVFANHCVLCANILYLDSVPSHSHHIWNEVLVRGLLEKDHNVTMIGYYDASVQSPNYTVLKMNYTLDFDQFNMDSIMGVDNTPIANLRMFWDFVTMFLHTAYESNALKTLLDYPNDKFDLIIFDVACVYFYPLIEHFRNPPVVAVSPLTLPPFNLNLMGAEFYLYYPTYVTPFSDRMTFWQKLMNYGLYLAEYVLQCRSNLLVEEKAKERFGPGIATFTEAQERFNVLLANYDPILDLPQPLPPQIIPVGGLHVNRPAELTEDLQRILDHSKDGVIFFSFGTVVQWSLIPVGVKKAFLAAFSKMKETVLWKYDQEDVENLPRNIVIRKWFPQSSILRHKNVKLFISHSGGLSTHEAISHGVPVLGIPFFGDQRNNIVKMEAKMIGKQLKLPDITEDVLREAIAEILHNPIYSERMRRYSEAYRSRKESALETAVFWVELVLKQKDFSYLWPRSKHMNFWERQNLDIFVFMSLLLMSVLVVLFKLVKLIIVEVFSGKSQRKMKQS